MVGRCELLTTGRSWITPAGVVNDSRRFFAPAELNGGKAADGRNWLWRKVLHFHQHDYCVWGLALVCHLVFTRFCGVCVRAPKPVLLCLAGSFRGLPGQAGLLKNTAAFEGC